MRWTGLLAACPLFGILFVLPTISAQAPAERPAAQPPRVFLVDPAALVRERAHPTPQELKLVRQEADKALRLAPQTVTNKTMTPPSGDKHDYMSMARYWWPNPETPNHLPYVRRDGEVNPEIAALRDHEALSRTAESARALALAWYLTGDARYADHAALLLRSFFLNPATAMNPNLNFAQAVPGKNSGRGAGVLDGRGLAFVVDAAGMLAGDETSGDANGWTTADAAGLQHWFAAYYTWLTTSRHGLQELAAPNNHGSWAAVQRASIAQYLGRTADVRSVAEQTLHERIPAQFDADGLQKYELERTNSFSYSAFNLQALTELASIVADTGIDLYQPVKVPGTDKTTGLLRGLDALLPYDAHAASKWPHQEITAGREDSICPALLAAAAHTQDAKYVAAEPRFGCHATGESLLQDPPD